MFLGLDIGTSGVKAVLVDADQRIVAEATVPLTVQRRHPQWSEQAPESWWHAVDGAVERVDAAVAAGFEGDADDALVDDVGGAAPLGDECFSFEAAHG